MRIIVSAHADENLHDISDYIQFHFGYEARRKFWKEFRSVLKLLLKNPNMGIVEPLLAEQALVYRSFVVNRLNKIVYRVVDDQIEILDFWDTRKEPQALVDNMK